MWTEYESELQGDTAPHHWPLCGMLGRCGITTTVSANVLYSVHVWHAPARQDVGRQRVRIWHEICYDFVDEFKLRWDGDASDDRHECEVLKGWAEEI